MAKGNILSDSFEQLAELGQSTAKKTVKSVAQTLNPFDKTAVGKGPGSEEFGRKTSEIKNKKDHTPLDFNKLKNKFQNKDKLKAEALRNRFFQIIKREEEKILERKNLKEKEVERQQEEETYEKRKKEQEKKQSQQQDSMPVGKAKRGTMPRKKSSEQQHVENKPASGKQ